MKGFAEEAPVLWNKAFWENDFPQLRIERLNELLTKFPKDVSRVATFFPERDTLDDAGPEYRYLTGRVKQQTTRAVNLVIHKVNTLINPPINGLQKIFYRMDHEFDSSQIDGLMSTLFSVVIQPYHTESYCQENPALFENMLRYIMERKISVQLKLKLVTEAWQIVEEIARKGDYKPFAETFLTYLSSQPDFKDMVGSLVDRKRTFREFLCAELSTEVTRFELFVFDMLDADNMDCVRLIHSNVWEKMLLLANANKSCPTFIRWASEQNNIALYAEFWKLAIRPAGTQAAHVIELYMKAYIDGLFYAYNDKYFQLDQLYNILADLIGYSEFKQALISQRYTPMEVNKIPTLLRLRLPIEECVKLLSDLWNELSINNDHQNKCIFIQHLFDTANLYENFELIHCLLQCNADFHAFVSSEEFFATVLKSRQDLRQVDKDITPETGEKVVIIRQYFKLFPERCEGPLFYSFIRNGIFSLLESLDQQTPYPSQVFLTFLEELHAIVGNDASAKELIIQTINDYFQKPNKKPHHLSRLLNEFALDRALVWFVLAYACEISKENVFDIYKQYNFLIKFRSLKNSPCSEDAEFIHIHYPRAENSLIALLNQLSLTRVDRLQSKPLLRWGETIGAQDWVAPLYAEKGLFYTEPEGKQRIIDGINEIDPEIRKVNNAPDPLLVHGEIVEASAPPLCLDDEEENNNNVVIARASIVKSSNSEGNRDHSTIAYAEPIQSIYGSDAARHTFTYRANTIQPDERNQKVSTSFTHRG
jgi:hypothetical protein